MLTFRRINKFSLALLVLKLALASKANGTLEDRVERLQLGLNRMNEKALLVLRLLGKAAKETPPPPAKETLPQTPVKETPPQPVETPKPPAKQTLPPPAVDTSPPEPQPSAPPPPGAKAPAIMESRSLSTSNQRIVNGKAVSKHAMPWQAILVWKGTTGLHCGGSIICPNFIISAAHCSYQKDKTAAITRKYTGEDHDILVGEHDLTNPSGTRHAIKTIHVHPEYEAKVVIGKPYKSKDYDVSIYELTRPIEMKPSSQAIHLPSPGDHKLPVGTMMTTSGWGMLEAGGRTSATLQATKVPLVADHDCKRAYPNTYTERQQCAGFLDTGHTDSCMGDSGGPLSYLEKSTDKVKLYGLVSYGKGCASPGYPGVYATVSTFLDWVNQVTGSCNQATCTSNCMMGAKLDGFTKKFFYSAKPESAERLAQKALRMFAPVFRQRRF